jgi:hypothetical protein
MQYYIRYTYNLALTAFQIFGWALLWLATGALALTAGAVTLDFVRRLLGYDLLLTQETLYWAGAVIIGLGGFGAALMLLGLSATDPKFLKKQGL